MECLGEQGRFIYNRGAMVVVGSQSNLCNEKLADDAADLAQRMDFCESCVVCSPGKETPVLALDVVRVVAHDAGDVVVKTIMHRDFAVRPCVDDGNQAFTVNDFHTAYVLLFHERLVEKLGTFARGHRALASVLRCFYTRGAAHSGPVNRAVILKGWMR